MVIAGLVIVEVTALKESDHQTWTEGRPALALAKAAFLTGGDGLKELLRASSRRCWKPR